jgi:membrane protease YdiL (CAAX protease family)
MGEALGSPWPAMGLASVSFGISHGYQRLIGIVRATLLGTLLALPVVFTGSLFPAIVAHFWINAVIGIGGWKLLYPEALLQTDTPRSNRD